MLEVTMASDPVREHQNQTSAAAAVTDHQDQVIGPSPISNGLKTVYFTVGQRKEVAVFEDQAPSEEIKSLFSSAAEAGPRDILKMYTPQGSLVNISNRLPSNLPDAPYRLELVAAHCNGVLLDEVGDSLATLEQRVSELEQRMRDQSSLLPYPMQDLKDQLDQLKQSLGLCRTGATFRHAHGLGRPYWNRHKCRRKSEAEKRLVCDKFLHISKMTLTEEIRRCLRMPTFDNWQWEDEEVLLLLQQMYFDLDLVRKFSIDPLVLRKFLCQVYMNYNEVPFHNFQHCFTVSQMMYGIIWCLDLPSKIGELETLILLTSCICHDLDHPGFNNIYQINARTELALRYNDISPLENHHCSVAFNILEDPSANIFGSVSPQIFKSIREGMIRSILATDMARHNDILNQFNRILPEFDFENREHINVLCMVLIKVSDISNEARPMDVAEPWLDCLLQEFYEQSDVEKLLGLPVTPFMDRDKVSRPSSQCSFIGFVLLPLFESIGRLFPELENLIVNPVREALDYYRKLNEASKEVSMSRSRQRSVEQQQQNHQQPAEPEDDGDRKADSSIHSPPVISNIVQQHRPHPSGTPIRDDSLSQEEIRRFSFGLEPDDFLDEEDGSDGPNHLFTEVEVCEKTSSFLISTIRQPAAAAAASGSVASWNKKNHSFCSAGTTTTTSNNNNADGGSRRASLAVMTSNEANNSGGGGRTLSGPHNSSMGSNISIVVEDENLHKEEILTAVPQVVTSNGISKEKMAPLAAADEASDLAIGNVSINDGAKFSPKISQHVPILSRIRQWTDRLTNKSEDEQQSPVPKSPGTTKRHGGLSRLFSRSASSSRSSTPTPDLAGKIDAAGGDLCAPSSPPPTKTNA